MATIAEIFAKQGEPYFRSAEREILKLLQPLQERASQGSAMADYETAQQEALRLAGSNEHARVRLAESYAPPSDSALYGLGGAGRDPYEDTGDDGRFIHTRKSTGVL